MGGLPRLTEPETELSLTTVFGGYHHSPAIPEGEWYDEVGLSSERYPLLSVRHRMSLAGVCADAPNGLMYRKSLIRVDGTAVYLGGTAVPGLTVTDGPKQLVSMGVYVCIFPDAVYFSVENPADCGSMGATYRAGGEAVTLAPCREDGSDYEGLIVSDTAPTEPEDGCLWLDTGGDTHVLRVWSETAGLWSEEATCHVRLCAPGIGEAFRARDAVTISGLRAEEGTDETVAAQVDALNAEGVLLQAVEPDRVILSGLVSQAVACAPGLVLERRVPLLDYVCEVNNRLWGCRYGHTDGRFLNEIYCCRLGDFTNWYAYEGLSTDSYAVSLGSDGPFTGCCHFGGSALFFKERSIHRVYGTRPSDFRLSTISARGVREGCGGSVQVVGEHVYYRSRTDICRFDGSAQPTSVSEALGAQDFSRAVAGVNGDRYVICMYEESGGWALWEYDTRRGIWHRLAEDLQVTAFASSGAECRALCSDGRILALNGTEGTPEAAVEWRCESGIIGYADTDRRYVSRLTLRARMEPDAVLEAALEYDSDGVWQPVGTLRRAGTGVFTFPVLPMRCDHFRLRLSGRGSVTVYALEKRMERAPTRG